ncbi:MAG: ClpXP protease specificity-enhancing factor SspB [Holosporales bacterium]|jgi:hypothetical protein|nr:ClpXP protease specificity-enhancing factor SspB [Holosporales bacterium]
MAKRIDYETLLRKASLSVVKDILKQVATDGLFRKQHLYITFAMNHPNVKASELLRGEFEDEMTIVLQYEFWDLTVDDFGFSVSLAFEHSDEALYIPFSSIISVSDPSENFSLNFTPDFTDKKSVASDSSKKDQSGKVISIDMFRK